MSRHNRRRTRGGHKNLPTAQRPSDGSVPDAGLSAAENSSMPATRSNIASRNNTSARHWHNRYMAWQARERRQREESESLEAAKKRIFGEDDGTGEDDGLCVKMLEYFDGLDFIHN